MLPNRPADGTLGALLGVPDGQLEAVVRGFAGRGWTLAAAESLTGGLLTAALTEVPGASAVVRGGLVVYATDLKHTLADVPESLLLERGPVDRDVAVALAEGARRRCGADVGVGLTGVAGPDRQGGVEVGTWFCAVVHPGAGRVIQIIRTGGAEGATRSWGALEPTAVSPEAPPSRNAVRAAAVRGALDALLAAAATPA